MPFFPLARKFKIFGGTFIDNNVVNNIHYHGHQGGIDLLREASEPDATHDSAARNVSPRCHPGTRKQYIEDLIYWAFPSTAATSPAPITWMKGHAGVGKSAIAQTCVERLQDLGVLFAAFFFTVDVRDNPDRLFPTIAYQLALLFPHYRDILNTIILHDQTILSKSLRIQFMKLIIQPLQQLATEGKGILRRFPIFIDGLDECRNPKAQFEIVQIVANAACTPGTLLCWAFFSRPEPHIEAAFSVPHILSLTHVNPLPISRTADSDIELYLRAGFQAILQLRNIRPRNQWPSERNLKQLVDSADGLFNYGATALRFIGDQKWLNLDEPLQLILNSAANITNSSSPFAEMDALYHLIMERIPTQALPRVSLVLSFLCYEKSTADEGGYGASMLGNCLGMSEMELSTICGHLSSVLLLRDQQEPLVLPTDIDANRTFLDHAGDQTHARKLRPFVWGNTEGSIGVFHKSFYDFLTTPSRSGIYCATSPTAYDNLLKCLLDIISHYEASYAFNHSKLGLAPGVISSASSLSFPLTDEFTNSLVMATAYIKARSVAAAVSNFPSTSPDLGRRFEESDHSKRLWISTSLYEHHVWERVYFFGCRASDKYSLGTSLCQVRQDFAKFDVESYTSFFECNREEILARIPKDVVLPSLRDNCESGVDILGHGTGATFIYWEIDLVACTFRRVWCTDLAMGINFFQAEHEWPEL